MASLMAAVNAGADAVYMGGTRFGARAFAENPDDSGLMAALDYVHLHGRKLFLTVNTLFKENELEDELIPFLEPLYQQGLDAVIVQDHGVMALIREAFPELPLHVSTQATVCDSFGVRALTELGTGRIVLPRELSLQEIAAIYRETGAELEVFIHGALCYCYSGQCLMSSFLGGRSGNRGRCAQPCRLPYRNGHLLNLKDLCTLDRLPELLAAGAYSLKVEGRMKSPEYTGGVIGIYRKYLDKLLEGREYRVEERDRQMLSALFDRGGFTDGYLNAPRKTDMVFVGEKPAFVTATEESLDRIRKAYLGERPVGIRGRLSLSRGKVALLELSRNGVTVRVSGDPVQTAAGRPLTEEGLRQQLDRLGDSGFFWEQLDVELEEGCFMPLSRLNALRREAAEELKRRLTESFRREGKAAEPSPIPAGKRNAAEKPILRAELDDQALLDTVLDFPEVRELILQGEYVPPTALAELAERVHAAGRRLFYALPYVFRLEEQRYFEGFLPELKASGCDGFLLRSLDELVWAKEQHLPGLLHTDAGVYAWNSRALRFLKERGAAGYTYPREPHGAELELPYQGLSREMILYGRIPMMVSAQCAAGTQGKCLRVQGHPAVNAPAFTPLKDRTGALMPVEHRCRFCTTVIYNALPLWLADEKLPAAERYRLSFTDEGPAETRSLLERICRGLGGDAAALKPPEGFAFTRGHFRKGVQ